VRREDNFRLKAMSTLDIKTKTIWELLSERGRKVGVINDPCSYPALQVNGFLVCGMLWPGGEQPYTYPESLAAELEKAVPNYIVDVNLHNKEKIEIAKELFRSIDTRLQASLYLMKQHDWDLFWTVFTESDRAQHRLWAAWDKTHPRHADEPEELRTAVLDLYEKLDAAVGAILAEVEQETTVFIVSDHGFGPFYAAFDLPKWLLDEGYIVERGEKAFLKSALKKIGVFDEVASVYKAVRKPFEKEIAYGTNKFKSQEASTEDYFAKLDWSKTRAYYTLDGGIRINLKGREPYGIVSVEEAEELKEQIRSKLLEHKFPNGEPVFRYILTQQEAFNGPYSHFAPDLVVAINHTGYNGSLKGNKYLMPSNHNTGEHTPYGVFIACGKNIKQGQKVEGASLKDVAPTVLYHLNEPLTIEMDGRALTEIFTPEFSTKHPVERKGTSYRQPLSTEGEEMFEDEAVADKLRSLGYIQ
ncbi:MAG: alkaline phosphatase family protein, partial [Blastocatellia bacterium]|nr:alkaline phosphatase family protein [Blastocatellia bacterium]